ncbi:MAG: hypothetical protein GKR95_15070 [Gammaproteobacteria bacterium]|nr:hypothetical protein [Gammaproteobacteria bacterium]
MKRHLPAYIKRISSRLWMCLFITLSGEAQSDQEALGKIHNWIKNEHPFVNHIQGERLESKLGDDSSLVLFDVREQPEYEISHLQNAIRVDPDISAKEFGELYGSNLMNKTVIFYCSVGRRSSVLAEKVQKQLLEQGSTRVLNLENGIFGWHNETRKLTRGTDETEFVHPYSWRWGRLIEREDLIRYDLD